MNGENIFFVVCLPKIFTMCFNKFNLIVIDFWYKLYVLYSVSLNFEVTHNLCFSINW